MNTCPYCRTLLVVTYHSISNKKLICKNCRGLPCWTDWDNMEQRYSLYSSAYFPSVACVTFYLFENNVNYEIDYYPNEQNADIYYADLQSESGYQLLVQSPSCPLLTPNNITNFLQKYLKLKAFL